jgi:simple sugar transport system permease protein
MSNFQAKVKEYYHVASRFTAKQGKKVYQKTKEYMDTDSFNRVSASLISALGGILVGVLIMVILDAQEFGNFVYTIFSGKYKFDSNIYILGAFVGAAPIIITGLSVGFAFRTGLFNIGASGQVLIGGITAIFVAHSISLPQPYHFIVAMLAAILAGGLWGFITGLFKAIFNINEVVTSIMMNYIAAYLVKYLVKLPKVYDFLRAQTKKIPASATTPTLGLNKIFPNSGFDISIFIAIFVAILMYVILNKTTLGYQLKAVGFNKDASMTSGIKYRRNIMISMAIAGALSGLAGAVMYLSGVNAAHIKAQVIVPSEGYDGISVALLALTSPIASIFSAYFINFLSQFGTLIEGASTFKKEISDVIISIIIYFSALSTMVVYWLNSRKLKRKIKNESKIESLEKRGDE